MRERRLRGVRVAVLAADGFEQVEVTVPMRALRRAGADVRIISLRPGRIRGMNFLWRGRELPVDDTVFKARPEDYGALFLPGGFVNPDLMRQSEHAHAFVRGMEQLGRPIATICHGPEVLISSGLVNGRRLTSWPGIADDVRNAGGIWEDAPVVHDGRWVASRSPKDLRPFTRAAIDLFAAEAARDLPPLRRRVHWVAHLSRLATLGLTSSLAMGARSALRARRRRAGSPALEVVRELGVATAVGALLMGKLARRPVCEGLRTHEYQPTRESWRRYSYAHGLGLAAAAVGWLAGRRHLRQRLRLRRATDVLLGGALATGLANVISGELLARRGASRARLDQSLAPAAFTSDRRLVRGDAIAAMAHAGALAGLICTTAALRAPR